jgi:hypothetical protein
MTVAGGEPSTTNVLQYSMMDVHRRDAMPLMFVNAAATCYLLSFTAPLAFMQAWTKALETTNGTIRKPLKPSASSNARINIASLHSGCRTGECVSGGESAVIR